MSKDNPFAAINQRIKPGGIVFLGDSIMRMFPIHQHFKPYRVYNRGISGNTTQDVLGRLETSIFPLKPKQIILMIGTNDFVFWHDNPFLIAQTIERICHKIHQFDPNIAIICCAVTPVHHSNHEKIDLSMVSHRDNEDIQFLNEKIKALIGITFVDTYTPLLDSDGQLDILYSTEGLHISEEGYDVLAKILRPHLLNTENQ